MKLLLLLLSERAQRLRVGVTKRCSFEFCDIRIRVEVFSVKEDDRVKLHNFTPE